MVDLDTGEILAPNTALANLDPSEIDRAADPGAFVVLCLERSKTWLTEALEQGDISSIVEMKSQAEAIRVYTMQKQLGKDSELAATEIVRRAERGIGLAIRQGQEAGEIAARGSVGGHPRLDGARGQHQAHVTDFGLTKDELSKAAYPLADIPAQEFEAALSEAKAEGNLSRANLKRKVKGEPLPQGRRPEHLRRMRHHDANRIVEQTVLGLEGYALGISLIDFEQLDRSQISVWSRSLSASLQSLNRLSRQLKELDQT
jgi:hypothetical protein